MKYEFKCPVCGNRDTFNIPMGKISSTEVKCSKCSSKTNQVFSSSLVVPEHMKASQINEMSYLNSIMNTNPSGKRKSIY